jgi:Ulp1 family protease
MPHEFCLGLMVSCLFLGLIWITVSFVCLCPRVSSFLSGVFTLKFADYASEGRPFAFSFKDMPYFRRRIALEIAYQKVI